MRIWHYELLPYLPDRQFRGQLRELVAILHDWRDKGKTNHLLINKVMEYRKSDLLLYFRIYRQEYLSRYKKDIKPAICKEFYDFGKVDDCYRDNPPFESWHDEEYLDLNMANLYEKHLAVGNSRVTDEEWERLVDGYNKITGNCYVLKRKLITTIEHLQ